MGLLQVEGCDFFFERVYELAGGAGEFATWEAHERAVSVERGQVCQGKFRYAPGGQIAGDKGACEEGDARPVKDHLAGGVYGYLHRDPVECCQPRHEGVHGWTPPDVEQRHPRARGLLVCFLIYTG